jgi:predicted DNA-binding transcriptional regulator AlpA
MTPRQIAHRNGLSDSTFYQRVRRGWCWYRAATTPARAYFYDWNPTC